MARKDGMAVRRERIQLVIKLVLRWLEKSENSEVQLSKVLAMLEFEIGARPERLREYLQVGVNMERFVIDEENDKIVTMKKAFSEG